MENKFSSEVPIKVEQSGKGFVLNYNVREATEEEILTEWKASGMGSEESDVPTGDFAREHKYVYHTVNVPMGQWNYGGIINAIVRDRYMVDEMESITNNMNVVVAEFFNVLVTDGLVEAIKYLLSSIKSDNMENFKQMQEWRAMAKREARSVLGMY